MGSSAVPRVHKEAQRRVPGASSPSVPVRGASTSLLRLPPACVEVHPGTVVAVALQQGVPVDVLCWIG